MILLALSLARYRIMSPISSASEDLPRGVFSPVSLIFSAGIPELAVMSVITGPGLTEFTRTPEGASSNAENLVKWSIPALEMLYGIIPGSLTDDDITLETFAVGLMGWRGTCGNTGLVMIV